MSTEAPDRPQPPVDAYAHVVTMLPDWYLTQPPPAAGSLLFVRGRDGIWTQWAMDPVTAAACRERLKRTVGLQTRIEPYGGPR